MAGITPDPWQSELVASHHSRMLLLCSRQAGKSTVAAALALQAAILEYPALVLLLSPSLRQSGELFRDKIMRLFRKLRTGSRVSQITATTLGLSNGSRIVSLPGDEETIRGFSGVKLLVIDEAARVPDDLYRSVRPMLAVSQGRLIGLSTPFGKRGWFYDAWTGSEPWYRAKVTAAECPRIDQAFLEEERRSLGQRWFEQEYNCSFEDTVDSVFLTEDIMAAMDDTIKPLFGPGSCPISSG